MNTYFNNDILNLNWGALSHSTLPKWAQDEQYYNCEPEEKKHNRFTPLLAIIILFIPKA